LPPYRLLAIDLDDTLFNNQLGITPRNREAIRAAQQAGVAVTLATGRMFRSAQPIAQLLNITLPIIAYQGALIAQPQTGDYLVHRPLPSKVAHSVISFIKPLDFHINLYLNDKLYMQQLTVYGRRYAALSGVDAYPVGDLVSFLADRAPTKLVAIGEPPEIDRLLGQTFPILSRVVHLTKSKPQFLEFSHPTATKGQALEWLAGHYGFKREEVLAIGDGYNDIDMVEWAGLGVMMGNAPEPVKALADHVAPANYQDGVADTIERFVLNELA
jgi:Cof subfamily protein (haloacid dehalogenase superfamily)